MIISNESLYCRKTNCFKGIIILKLVFHRSVGNSRSVSNVLQLTVGKLAEFFLFSWIIHSLFRLAPLHFVKEMNYSSFTMDINCINLLMLFLSLILFLTFNSVFTFNNNRGPETVSCSGNVKVKVALPLIQRERRTVCLCWRTSGTAWRDTQQQSLSLWWRTLRSSSPANVELEIPGMSLTAPITMERYITKFKL